MLRFGSHQFGSSAQIAQPTSNHLKTPYNTDIQLLSSLRFLCGIKQKELHSVLSLLSTNKARFGSFCVLGGEPGSMARSVLLFMQDVVLSTSEITIFQTFPIHNSALCGGKFSPPTSSNKNTRRCRLALWTARRQMNCQQQKGIHVK